MKYIAYNSQSFKKTKYYKQLPEEEQEAFDILTSIFHFKTNNYVLEHLINWENVPNDPIYRLLFLRKEMLSKEDYNQLKLFFSIGEGTSELKLLIEKISPYITEADSRKQNSNIYMLKNLFNPVLPLKIN